MSERSISPRVVGHGSMNEQPGRISGALSVAAHHMKKARKSTTGMSSRKTTPRTHVIHAGGRRKRCRDAASVIGDDWWVNVFPLPWMALFI